ncbi:MAG: UvrD-helicase domain-containing protein [Bacteroidota bacterium]
MSLKIYKSSAGSGKTFVLTKEYIKILLKDPYAYKNVLAITFTNKATSEMKQRILEELSGIADNNGSDLQMSLENDFSVAGEYINIVKNAALAYKNILHNYSRFEISTIDSFFTRVVKSCARELGLSSRYEIELGNDLAIEYAVRKLYSDLKKESQIGKWLKEFSLSQIEKDKGWDIDYQITDLAKELFKEEIQMGFRNGFMKLDKLSEQISSIRKTVLEFEKTAARISSECLEIIKKTGLALTDFRGGSKSFALIFERISKKRLELTNTFKTTISENEGWYSKTSPQKDQIELALGNGLLKRSRELLKLYEENWADYISAQEMLKNYYSYALLGALSENVKSYRDENDLLLLSDTNSIVQQTIKEDDAPFLFEKIGSRYRHILIDEFQDTSSYQWENLKPLILSSLSSGNDVLIVGDVKQSIYRWRGGDMNLLLNQVQEDLEIYRDETEELVLNNNWRSSKEIVDFNNQFFPLAVELLKNLEDVKEPHLLDKAYSDIRQNPKKDSNGYVKVSLLNKDEHEDLNIAFLENLLNHIEECIADGYAFSDIMILVDRGARAIEIAEYLADQRIPCVTENALLLKNAAIVDLLVDAIKVINSPEERFFRVQFALKYVDFKGIKEFEVNEETLSGLFGLFNQEGLESRSPYELIQVLLSVLLPGDKDVYLQTFLNNVSQLGRKGIVGLNQFLDWWEIEKESLKVEGQNETEAIQILTIHKSKGLESPVVMIPFADFLMKTRPGTTIWTESLSEDYSVFNMLPLNFSEKLKESHFAEAYHEEFIQGLLDRVNVAYVAFTRARERLYIAGERVKKLKDPSKLNLVLQSVLENPDFIYKNDFVTDNGIFQYGKRSKKELESNAPQKETYILESLISSKGSEKLELRSQSDHFFRLLETESSEKIKRGLKIHIIFEHLDSAESLTKTINYLKEEGFLEQKEIEGLIEDVESILKIPEVQLWFETDWDVFREREIWYDGRIYKPDRVLMKGNEAIIIDFKKDKESSDHKHQLNAYASVISKMGFERIQKYLLYVESRKVMKVA